MPLSPLQRLAGILTLTLAAGSAAHAQSYPSKPITMVVPFSAGAGTDQVARGLAQSMQAAMPGASIIIDNRPGASGSIAARTAAAAEPDGYTLLVTTNTTQSANPHLFKSLPYDPVADFEPIAAITRGSVFLAVPADSPYDSLADVVEAGKTKLLSFGAGNSSSQVAGEMFRQMTGSDMLYVPYKSNPQAVTDLVGGQFDVMFADPASSFALIQSGKIKALAYAGESRLPALPDVPTFKEEGFPDYELYYWVAVYAPKGTPQDIITRLNEVILAAVPTDPVQNVYKNAMLESFTTTPQGLAEFQQSETEKWGRVIKAAGIEPT